METLDIKTLAELRGRLIDESLWTQELNAAYYADVPKLSGGVSTNAMLEFWTKQEGKLAMIATMRGMFTSLMEDASNGDLMLNIMGAAGHAVAGARLPTMGDWPAEDEPECPVCGGIIDDPSDLRLVRLSEHRAYRLEEGANAIMAHTPTQDENFDVDVAYAHITYTGDDVAPCLIRLESMNWVWK